MQFLCSIFIATHVFAYFCSFGMQKEKKITNKNILLFNVVVSVSKILNQMFFSKEK
jgi:hypothetical protein